MANITQLQITGSSTIHNLNDARISATAVTTATHVLTANSGVTSIAPIAVADLASVLGVLDRVVNVPANSDLLDYIIKPGIYTVNNAATAETITNGPVTNSGYSVVVHRHHSSNNAVVAVAYCNLGGNAPRVGIRNYVSNVWGAWKFLAFE